MAFGFGSGFIHLSGSRAGGGGLAAATAIIKSAGGALFLLENGDVFQDRSVTPSTAAGVGDPVGTMVGRDGTWFAVASSDGARMTLRETADGRRYLEGVRNTNRYNVQNAAAGALTPDGVLFTAFFSGWGFPSNNTFGPFAWGSDNFKNSYVGTTIGATNSPYVVNSGSGQIDLCWYLPHNQNSVYTLRHQNNPTLRIDGSNTYSNQETGNVFATTVGQFAIGTRDNDAQREGAARLYCIALVPAILTDQECSSVEAALYPYVRQPSAPISAAEVNIDFANSVFTWGGASRVLGDLTDNLDGSYTLDYTDWGAPGYLISIDFNVPDWSLNTAGQRLLRVERDNTINVVNREAFFYDEPSDNIHYRYSDVIDGAGALSVFGIGAGQSKTQQGLQRATLWIRPGEPARFQLNGYIWQATNRPLEWRKNPDGLTVWEDFTSGNVLRMRAKGGTFTEEEASDFHAESDLGLSVHLLGDSFVVFGEGSALALQRVITSDGYCEVSHDGVGGATMANHLVRFGGYSATGKARLYASTLIINDGGWSYTDEPASSVLSTIDGMVALLDGHDRWMYVEPWPIDSLPAGATRDLYEAQQAAIAADIGARYVPTVHAAQCAHDDSAEDLADVAVDLIPESMSADGIHPRTTAGYTVLARCIRGALGRLGYWDITTTAPGAPTSFAETALALSWSMPADDGGDPVRSWTVTRETSAGSGTFTQVYSGQLRRHTLTGLTTGTWKVRVTSTNSISAGPAAEINVVVA